MQIIKTVVRKEDLLFKKKEFSYYSVNTLIRFSYHASLKLNKEPRKVSGDAFALPKV
jgi:hypothetical protein